MDYRIYRILEKRPMSVIAFWKGTLSYVSELKGYIAYFIKLRRRDFELKVKWDNILIWLQRILYTHTHTQTYTYIYIYIHIYIFILPDYITEIFTNAFVSGELGRRIMQLKHEREGRHRPTDRLLVLVYSSKWIYIDYYGLCC